MTIRRQLLDFPKRVYYIGSAVVNGFLKDNCYLYASSLTFYSLLSIVPILAIAFGLGKSFGIEYYLEKQLLHSFPQQEEWIHKLIDVIYSLLENTHGGLIASVGGLTLVWTMFKLLENVEEALNHIWKVRVQRNYGRKFSDYTTMTIFAFFFFAVSNGFIIYIVSTFLKYRESHAILQTLTPFVLFSLIFFPFLLSWVLFSFLYYFMPNIKVNLKFAVLAGFFASTLYHVLQWIYLHFQIGVASYGAIYGSFAAIPLFLVWLNMSWIVILLGAEIAYHGENSFYLFTERLNRIKVTKKELALLVTKYCAESFAKGNGPVSIEELCMAVGISLTTARRITYALQQGAILIESGYGNGLMPARDVESLTINYVLEGLDKGTEEYYFVNKTSTIGIIQKHLDEFHNILISSSGNVPVIKI